VLYLPNCSNFLFVIVWLALVLSRTTLLAKLMNSTPKTGVGHAYRAFRGATSQLRRHAARPSAPLFVAKTGSQTGLVERALPRGREMVRGKEEGRGKSMADLRTAISSPARALGRHVT
jgi:hypothetical protein